jgi:hypothetical protein
MLSPRLHKPWRELSESELEDETTSTGVYEIADGQGRIVDIGYAGAGSRFGLREALGQCLAESDVRLRYRVEVNHNYLSRYRELLLVHRHDYGELPIEVARRGGDVLGRLNPS